ncbi:hypothetical protein D9M72_564190 [compost metagenome]
MTVEIVRVELSRSAECFNCFSVSPHRSKSVSLVVRDGGPITGVLGGLKCVVKHANPFVNLLVPMGSCE